MVKTCYTGLNRNHMARVGPRGTDGKEIPVLLPSNDSREVFARRL